MLSATNLTVRYGERIVIHNLSIEAYPGQILALIGPNGAGKSTLIRAISGVIPISSGSILMNGKDIGGLSHSQRARLLSVVPQARQMGGAFTVEQAVMMGRTPYLNWIGQGGESDRTIVKNALRQTSLEEFADRQIAKLSGGEQQRVLLARALAQTTPIMLLDEPTNHLDLHHQFQFLTLLKRLSKELSLTILMAMHDLNLVSIFADRLALMMNGVLKYSGLPSEVIRPDIIEDAYQMPVEITHHETSGIPLVIPKINPTGIDRSQNHSSDQ